MGDSTSPPRERLVRAVFDPPMEFRAATNGDGTLGTLTGHFAVFDQPTEINSVFEGRFMETVAPGAFKKTLRENANNIKVLYDHGHDPSVGNKPLGVPSVLREDGQGAYYEVPLFDTSYNRDLIPSIRAGALGASFRFRVVREDFVNSPGRSASNPEGIPERTITEAAVAEFGPVTFPAYAGATAGMRSMTDDFLLDELDTDRLGALLVSRGISVPKALTPEPNAPFDSRTPAIKISEPKITVRYVLPDGAEIEQGERAVWSTSYVNDLPDSAFLYVESGGTKDSDGKTVPRTLRHFPYKDSTGAVDLPHLRNALARIPQSDLPDDVKASLTKKAQGILADQNNSAAPDGEVRADQEDLDVIDQMVALAHQYIDQQDEGEDQRNIPVMQNVLSALDSLSQVEQNEVEPADETDDGTGGRSSEGSDGLFRAPRFDREAWRL